jgi:DNA-binding CsgD family transcriptional regulator/tetratricopeptide (TPR) repeat protein
VGVPLVRRAVRAVPDDRDRLLAAALGAHDTWDDEAWAELADRHVRLARRAGALAVLPAGLGQRIGAHLHAGELGAAEELAEESAAVTAATGGDHPTYGEVLLLCWRGRTTEALPLLEAAIGQAEARGEGRVLGLLRHAEAVLHNGCGRYAEALAAAEQAGSAGFPGGALAELVEAAVRSGEPDRAASAVRRLARVTTPSGTAWARGIEARSRALAGEDARYREAIDHLARCRGAFELARTHLVYGEWLRREGRRVDARTHLRNAHEALTAMGAEAFAERARRELLATGETVRKRSDPADAGLTPQERQIARRARDGHSNSEIGAELFLSARTIEWHLHKIFGKLGITSRRELRKALEPA